VAVPEGLRIGAVGEGDLDSEEHLARARLGPRHVLHAQVARAVEAERPQGLKTTFVASPRR
jgi:hypothetical protein